MLISNELIRNPWLSVRGRRFQKSSGCCTFGSSRSRPGFTRVMSSAAETKKKCATTCTRLRARALARVQGAA